MEGGENMQGYIENEKGILGPSWYLLDKGPFNSRNPNTTPYNGKGIEIKNSRYNPETDPFLNFF